jgi:hypothetical protein
MDLIKTESELKKRWPYKYHWGQKQNDLWDDLTNFIYKSDSFEQLLKETEKAFSRHKTNINRQNFFNYAANRWYNFNSAMAVEQIICSVPDIEHALNPHDRLVDFTINGIRFDHKTSVYPEGFRHDIEYAIKNKKELIEWLYANQSQQKRKHLDNRLFIIVYAQNGKHWKLKAEIGWLKDIILNYANNFNEGNLTRLKLKNNGEETLSDIIWAVKKEK